MSYNFFLTLALILGVYLGLKILKKFFHQKGESKNVSQKRIYYILKTVQIIFIIIALVILGMIWSVSFSGMLLFASSAFAVIGVALFAQWSILSNITSSIIVFFTFPTRVGDIIKIVDGDNSVIGKIHEISLFHIELHDKDGHKILYPNNLFTQKPIFKLKDYTDPKPKEVKE